jgi:uncharacterized phage-associated protein
MYDARGVANFFIGRALECSRPISAMTLLKVLYFAHGWYLAKHHRALVAQPFEAWKHGPVVRVVYDQIKGQGSKSISYKLKSFDVDQCGFVETCCSFSAETERFLADIFDCYSQFHPFTLSDLTHIEGSPWDVVWSKAERKAVPGMVISNNIIKTWFERGGHDNNAHYIRGYNT